MRLWAYMERERREDRGEEGQAEEAEAADASSCLTTARRFGRVLKATTALIWPHLRMLAGKPHGSCGRHYRYCGAFSSISVGEAFMAWIRLDDRFSTHPKVVSLSNEAYRLYIDALCYSSLHQTDGQISSNLLAHIASKIEAEVRGTDCEATATEISDELVNAGLWEKDANCWKIHDYLDYNLSKENRRKLSEMRSKSGRKGGKANTKQVATHLLSQRTSKVEANDRSSPSPSPSQTQTVIGEEKNKDLPPPDDGDARAKKPRQTNPDVKRVIGAYQLAYEKQYKKRPLILWGKYGKISQTMLLANPVDDVLYVVEEFIKNPPAYFRERNLSGFEHIPQAFNQLLTRRAKKEEPYG